QRRAGRRRAGRRRAGRQSRSTESMPHVGEGQSNDILNNVIVNDNTDETTTENTTENLNNPSNGRKQVQVVNGLFDKSSECSREITKIFKEKIDDTGYTWTKVSQPTKNFYFGEFKKHFVWDPKTKTRVRKAWDAKASGRYADFLRDIRAKMVKPIFMSDSSWTNFTSHWATSKYKEI
nr:PDR ABC-type transporter family protein [Tanacetum cinerariifolium]